MVLNTCLFLVISAICFRMALLEAALALGIFCGNISSSYIFYATNYSIVFFIAAFCFLLGILYTFFLIPESVENIETEVSINYHWVHMLSDSVYCSYFIYHFIIICRYVLPARITYCHDLIYLMLGYVLVEGRMYMLL